ncbi:proteinase inhibitor I78 [Kitasatospora sp. NPDC101183]|uniref:proteinase inhibitor I78 n=1 Tax=Kitasatospora sp. NPDC101183 TaxID=3364100 RepID=UPI0037FE514B
MDAERYVGMTVERAREAAGRDGWALVRELDPEARITMEYREGRLNLTVRGGVVERAWEG